jgi:hypothetical protein
LKTLTLSKVKYVFTFFIFYSICTSAAIFQRNLFNNT